jgi:hypothetical protein
VPPYEVRSEACRGPTSDGPLLSAPSALLVNVCFRSQRLIPSRTDRCSVQTIGPCGSRQIARVRTYEDILAEYDFHPEAKCADSVGRPCVRQTLGLLERRHVKIDQIKCIGKESNSLENVNAGLVYSERSAYTEYVDLKRDEWTTKIQPVLKKASLIVLVRECGKSLSRRELIELRAGRSRPHRKTQDLLSPILKGLGLL